MAFDFQIGFLLVFMKSKSTNSPLLPHLSMQTALPHLSRCYHRKTLYSFARHYESGEPLPEELYQRLLAARTYR